MVYAFVRPQVQAGGERKSDDTDSGVDGLAGTSGGEMKIRGLAMLLPSLLVLEPLKSEEAVQKFGIPRCRIRIPLEKVGARFVLVSFVGPPRHPLGCFLLFGNWGEDWQSVFDCPHPHQLVSKHLPTNPCPKTLVPDSYDP